MDLSKLPPFVTMTLGLVGCVAEACLSPPFDPITSTGTAEGSVDACLSPPFDDTGSTGASGSTGTSGTAGTGETFTTSACLSPPLDTGSESGPGSDTGTGTSSGESSGSDSDSGSGTTGMMADEPLPPTRAAAVERVMSRGTLPADVLDRLRALASSTKDR